MSEKRNSGEARRQRMLRELQGEHREPTTKLAAAGVLALFLVAAFAVIETQQAASEPRSVPVATAKSQASTKEKRPAVSPVRLFGSAASSGVY